ncbi:glycosyltransferase family 39 protein [Synechococcus sp. CCY 9618]|uniref:glycosyltransferase family 39 protein n=1 Tax=Synechococcus sp. CCY 9618 TaxID=2815602 RepID=UPI001C23F770|nr:glycosyltransferase family 39 protein [Synechococcus sp. CCY 9618]
MTTGRLEGNRWWLLLAIAVAVLFALRALALIDATSLWGDELSSARKAFQPSLGFLLDYLREDTHPPLYYLLLWACGRIGPQTAAALRAFSWIAYLLGGITITALVARIAVPLPLARRRLAIGSAVLLAFCSPFPVRFSIEGKGYSLLVLGVALSLLCRCRWLDGGRRLGLLAYGGSIAAASLTHYYGLFHGLCLAGWDLWRFLRSGDRRRPPLVATAVVGVLPSLGWIWYSRRYLLSGGEAGSWIGRPDWALVEDTLARLLGPAPLLKLAVIALGCWAWRRLCRRPGGEEALAPPPGWLDAGGVLPAVLLVVGVVGVSFFKPLAFARYFVVVLPALVVAVSVGLAVQPVPLPGWPRRAAVAAVVLTVVLFWHDAFLTLDPAGVFRGSREQNDFRSIVLLTREEPLRFSPRPHHFRTAEQLLVNRGTLARPGSPWRHNSELEALLAAEDPPAHFVLAATSGPRSVQRRVAATLEQVEALGYRCRRRLPDRPHIRLLVCKPEGAP